MSDFKYVRIQLPHERQLRRAAIEAGISSFLHVLAADGIQIDNGGIRIRSTYDVVYLREEVLITWDGPGE